MRLANEYMGQDLISEGQSVDNYIGGEWSKIDGTHQQDIVNTAAMMEGSIPSRGPAIRHSTTTITAASTE